MKIVFGCHFLSFSLLMCPELSIFYKAKKIALYSFVRVLVVLPMSTVLYVRCVSFFPCLIVRVMLVCFMISRVCYCFFLFAVDVAILYSPSFTKNICSLCTINTITSHTQLIFPYSQHNTLVFLIKYIGDDGLLFPSPHPTVEMISFLSSASLRLPWKLFICI